MESKHRAVSLPIASSACVSPAVAVAIGSLRGLGSAALLVAALCSGDVTPNGSRCVKLYDLGAAPLGSVGAVSGGCREGQKGRGHGVVVPRSHRWWQCPHRLCGPRTT